MERQFSYRVRCPSCDAWAQLRVAYRDGRPPIVVMLSCPNQTEAMHAPPCRRDLARLIPHMQI